MLYRAAFFLLLILAIPAAASSSALPDALDDWTGTPPQVTELIVTKDNENAGQWVNRVYTRPAPFASVEANLTEGPGPGTLFVPDGPPPESDGITLEPSSAYETLTVAGKRAVLESDGITGQALAAALGKDRTLTLETKSLSRDELLAFAQKLIAVMEGR